MWRTCGAIPSTPLASSARRCSTPKRCCSSTTQRPSRAKRTVGSISAWVPTISPSSPLASWSSASPAPRRRRRAGQQREGGRLCGEQLAEGHRVLLGERLGRRHQHRLEARFQRPQHRVEGDHRLARADLPHQQPLHRLAGVEVGVDLVEGRELVAGRLERQRLDPAPDRLARACRAAAPAARPGARACASPGAPGRGRALRSRSRSRACSTSSAVSGKCTALIASAAPASPRRARSSRRQRLDHVAGAEPRSPAPIHSPDASVGFQLPRSRGGPGRGPAAVPPRPRPRRRPTSSYSVTRKPRLSSEPVSSSRRPCGQLLAPPRAG